MKYFEYETAFSTARLSRYLNACYKDQVKALLLYRYNIKLCQKFYGILNVLEVILRNSINNHYKSVFGDDNWIKNSLSSGGMLEFCPKKSEAISLINKLEIEGKCSNDRVVSSMSFGFWTYMFTKVPFMKGGQNLLCVLPHRTVGVGQKTVYNELQEIKAFRNRIAHHEPICFDSFGNKSTMFAREHYALILKYIRFLGYSETHLLYGLDVMPGNIFDKIDSM